MKTINIIPASCLFCLAVCSISCKDESNILLEDAESKCWLYTPIKSMYPFDQYSGICLFSDGKYFEYINREGYKIPYGTYMDTIDIREIIKDWTAKGDSLFIGNRRYHMERIAIDTIMITDDSDSIMLVMDTTATKINWGSKTDSVPNDYLH